MSFTEAFRPVPRVRVFYDVHIWPDAGRIVVIDADPGIIRPEGMRVTAIDVRESFTGLIPVDETARIAAGMVRDARSRKLESEFIEHTGTGDVWAVDPDNYERSPASHAG